MLAGILLNLPVPAAGRRKYKTLVHKEIAELGCVSICDDFKVEFNSGYSPDARVPSLGASGESEQHVVDDEISEEEILALLFALDI